MRTLDRLSALPDEVISRILSFLPTENAVATSILSKRWRPLCRSLPALNFNDETYLINDKPYSSFRNFVNRTIIIQHHQPITRFRLKCVASNCDPSDVDVNVWVNYALQRGVENLEVHLLLKLNLNICSCGTLVVLKLRGLHVRFSSSVEFPSLKTLHLKKVEFSEPRNVMDLLRGCPILEDLEATEIYTRDGSSYEGEFTNCLPKLVRAVVSRTGLNIPLQAICNTRFLVKDEYAQDTVDIPIFPNLAHLGHGFESGYNWHFILAMLKQSPKLQCIVLEPFESYPDVAWPYPRFIPEYLSSQLTNCTIINYEGKECELLFAKYIMQNSTVLSMMEIRSNAYGNKLEMLKELSLCPRSSATCELLFN